MLKSIRLLKPCTPTRVSNSIRSYYSPGYLQYLRSLPEAEVTCVEGLAVASEASEAAHVTVTLTVDHGARHDAPHEAGAAHLLTRLALAALRRALAGTGAALRARTSRQAAALSAACPPALLPAVVPALLACALSPPCDPAELERHKQLVYQEMLQLEREPDALLMDYLHQAAYQDTALAQPVRGRSDTVRALDAAAAARAAARRGAGCALLAAAGPVEHAELLALAAACPRPAAAPCPAAARARYTGSEIRYRNDDWPAAHVAVAFEAPGAGHEDLVALEVARQHLGAWAAGAGGGGGGGEHPARLARAAAAGLCHSYRAFSLAYSDTGLWGVRWAGASRDLEDFLYNVQDEVMHLCCSVTDAELGRARAAAAAAALRGAGGAGAGPLHARVCAAASVSAADVRAACSRYLYDACPAVAAVGATEGLPEYNRIRSGTYWLRL
ncbi:mitochondrial-processing peptidase subunit beta-like [Plutella xylostella]|uniref:mitochondrial-processing peptidase subunit beta-like n=1 Tax=Plutella xylostella TaxID=51655 RepID=UPI0020325BE8|nr:mitochondrial-processing peptidase subunit beta-like [Plutella xylostella]